MNSPRLVGVLGILALMVACSSSHQLSHNQPPSTGVVISISPSTATPGSPDLILSITGADFVQGPVFSQAVWSINGADTFLATSFIDDTHLTAVVPAALLVNPTVAEVYVRNWDHIENVVLSRSKPASFLVGTSSASSPFISSISPANASAGSTDLQVTIEGNDLVPTVGHEYAAVGWYESGKNEALLTPTSVANDEIVVVIPATLLSKPTTSTIVVEFRDYRDFLDDPPHAKSNSVSFAVN